MTEGPLNESEMEWLEETLMSYGHVRHLFLGVTTQKRGCTFKTVIAAPGAHLLVEQR